MTPTEIVRRKHDTISIHEAKDGRAGHERLPG